MSVLGSPLSSILRFNYLQNFQFGIAQVPMLVFGRTKKEKSTKTCMPPTCPRVPAFEVVPREGELDRHLLRG